MDDPVRRTGAERSGLAEREAGDLAAALRAHDADRVGRDGTGGEAGLQSKVDQNPAGIRRQFQARPGFLESLGFLQNDDAKAFPRQRERRRQSPDPGTGNDDGAGRRHLLVRRFGSGDFVLYDTFGRAGFAGGEVRGEPIERGAIRADDFVVVAEVEKNVRMIEGRVGAHAHKFLRADLDDRNTGIIVKVWNDVIGHILSPAMVFYLKKKSFTRRRLLPVVAMNFSATDAPKSWKRGAP